MPSHHVTITKGTHLIDVNAPAALWFVIGPCSSGVTMAHRLEYIPGDPASAMGVYEQLNIVGRPVGVRCTLAKGQPFPAAPRGHTWTLTEEPRPGV
jgi:hypothetical protein